MLDIPSLPDIEDRPPLIFKKIDTGVDWQVIDFLFQRIHV
jgi:hypothetical protein